MFRKILSFTLIMMVVSVFVAWQSVSASSATDSSGVLKPTKTPTRTKTSTPTHVPSATATLPAASLIVTSPNGGEVFQNGEVHSITWQSSSDIQYVDILVGSWVTCEGCAAYWSTEWNTGPISNSGSYDWTIALDESSGKQYFVMVIGQSFDGSSYTSLALDVSNRPFTVLPSATPTATATDEPSATPTASATSTGTSTITLTPTTTFTRTPTVTWTPDNPD